MTMSPWRVGVGLVVALSAATSAAAGDTETRWRLRFVPSQSRTLELATQQWAQAVEACKFKDPAGVGPLATLRFLVALDPLFKDHKFLPERSAHYLARIKAVTADSLEKWHTAMEQATADRNRARSLFLLVQQDALFTSDGKLKEAALGGHATRLRSVPVEAVKEWVELWKLGVLPAKANYGDPRDLPAAAVAQLVSVDALFDQNHRFDPAAFRDYCKRVRAKRPQGK